MKTGRPQIRGGGRLSENSKDDREEILKLREENLRLREQRLQSATKTATSTKANTPTVTVKQVNEGFFSGCAGMIGIIFVLSMLLSQCSG